MTADEVGRVNVFDYTKVGAEQTPELAKAGAPYLVLQHSGHRGTVWDIQWNPYDPWTVCSTSVGDFQNTLQLWRVNDMIYRDTEECIRELEEHRDIICGRQAPLKSKNPAQENKEDSEGAAEKDDASGADADDAMEE